MKPVIANSGQVKSIMEKFEKDCEMKGKNDVY